MLLFGYFWGYNFKKLLSYFKSAPSNLSNCKLLLKNKNPQICGKKKMPYLGIFGLGF